MPSTHMWIWDLNAWTGSSSDENQSDHSQPFDSFSNCNTRVSCGWVCSQMFGNSELFLKILGFSFYSLTFLSHCSSFVSDFINQAESRLLITLSRLHQYPITTNIQLLSFSQNRRLNFLAVYLFVFEWLLRRNSCVRPKCLEVPEGNFRRRQF
jgi:hypothetical protein